EQKDTIEYIPGVRVIEQKDLPSYLQQTNTEGQQFLDKAFKEVKKADFILCNTVQELESHSIFVLQEKKSIYAIGPLLNFPNGFTKRNIVPTSMRTEFDCSQWLNTKPQGSVLYISFGSSIPSQKSDIEEIAHGLVKSGVNFIWVLRHDCVSFEEPYFLPIGIQDEIKGKGLVVTWTNQIEIMSHPSIGGFLTHCGWNSIIESLQCSGVPLLCFPLRGDQFTNRKIVVDDWGIGINLCDSKPLTRVEVAAKINRLMLGKSANKLKKEVIKVRQMVLNALPINGSSEKSLSNFIIDVKAKINGRIADDQ
ncbi:UDP-glycosyltransferase 86A1-like, partial [Morus notabilis]